MEEIWKPIPKFKGYEASNLGSIRSINRIVGGRRNTTRRIKGRIIRQVTTNGYKRVNICNMMKQAHTLILIAFKPDITGLLETNHVDGDKCNNNIDNLEWVTSSENQIHAVETGLQKSGSESPNAIPVDQYDKNGNFIKSYGCITEASKETGIHKATISNSMRNTPNNPIKYIWKKHNNN